MAAGNRYKSIKEHTHTQSTAAATWTIQHNCGGYPVVDVFVEHNSVVQKIIPMAVNYVDGNNLTIEFTSARSGVAKIVG